MPGLIVSRALQMAQSEPRGPVYLSLPREIAFLPTQTARVSRPRSSSASRARRRPIRTASREIAERLVKARNPVALVAALRPQSGDRAGAGAARRAPRHAPVGEAAARSYHCFPMNHPLYQSTTLDLAKADVVLVIEADVPWIPGPQQPPARRLRGGGRHRSDQGAHPDLRVHRQHAADRRHRDRACACCSRRWSARRHGRPRALRRARRRAGRRRRAHGSPRASRRPRAGSQESPISPLWLSYQIGQAMDDNCLMVDETLMLSPLPPYLRFAEPGTLLPQSRQRRRLVRRRRARRQARPAGQGRGRGHRRRLLHVFGRQRGDRRRPCATARRSCR